MMSLTSCSSFQKLTAANRYELTVISKSVISVVCVVLFSQNIAFGM